MTDLNLIIFGCIVLFIAYAGAYVYLRERFMAGRQRRSAPRREEASPRPVA